MNRFISESNKKRMLRKAEDRFLAGAYSAILAFAFDGSIPDLLILLLYAVSVIFVLTGAYYIFKYFDY